jgi:predicted nucleotidyltransferase
MPAQIAIDSLQVASFCRKWKVAELALFGSVLRADFRPDSDVDILVSWLPDADVSMLTIGAMAADLEDMLGRRVDLVPKSGLKPFVRDEVLGAAEVIYAA